MKYTKELHDELRRDLQEDSDEDAVFTFEAFACLLDEIDRLNEDNDYLTSAVMESETIDDKGRLRGSIVAIQKEVEQLREEVRWRKYPDEKPDGLERILATDGFSVHTTYYESCNKNALTHWKPVPELPGQNTR